MTSLEWRRWFVVYCKSQREEFARLQLGARGVEVFLPKLRLPEYLERRRRIVPLFPNYLFVNIDPHRDFYTVLWTPGVKRFVSAQTAGAPTAVDDGVVRFLRDQAGPDGVVAGRADLQPGQSVEITRGPFEGLLGIIQRPPNARGRIRVLMQILNRPPIKVDVPVQSVKTAWVV
jgi:transcriptional antiterminator RfaH